MRLKALKTAFPYTIPIFMGHFFTGMAFGLFMVSKGFNFWWPTLMSLFIYAGSMQFVAVELMFAPFDIVNAIILTFSVNGRHLFYGLSLLERLKGIGAKKPWIIYGMTDSTYSQLVSLDAPEEVDKGWFYFWIATLNGIYWTGGTFFGAFAGSLITFNTKGIDFVLVAMFTTIFVNQWDSTKNHFPALTGVFCAIICLVLLGQKNFILPSLVIIFAVLVFARKKMEGRNAK